MQTGRAVLHPSAALRPPWHAHLAIATADVAKHLALTLAVVLGGTVAVALVLVLALAATPVAALLAVWILWRWARGGAREARRFTLRARRRASSLGLRIVRGAADARDAAR